MTYLKLIRKIFYILIYFCFANIQSSFAQNLNAFWSNQFSTSEYSADIYAIIVDSRNGDVYIGGNFNSIMGVSASRIAKWNGSNWVPLGLGTNGSVSSLAINSDTLFVGGIFTTAGGITVNRIAKYIMSQNTWEAMSYNGNVGLAYSIGSYTPSVDAMAVVGNRLYIGGAFFDRNGSTTISEAFCYWDGKFNSVGSGVVGQVYDMELYGSTLYVGGSFSSANGVSNTSKVAALNTSNNSWSALGSGITDATGYITSLAVDQTTGIVYVGGNFTAATSKLQWWNGSWVTIGGTGLSSVNDLATDASGNLYVVGGFTSTSSGISASCIAKWKNSSWSALGSGITYSGNVPGINSIAIDGSNIYVGGNFTAAGGHASYRVARYYPQSYNITGNVTLNSSDAKDLTTVSLGGYAPYATTTDASGNYSLQVGTFGSYTVTPSRTSYTFSPASSSTYSNVSSNIGGVNFTGTGQYSLTVNVKHNGVNLSGVTLALTGPVTAGGTTDVNGSYTFTTLPNGSYNVACSKTGFTFSSGSTSITNANNSLNIIATGISVSGNIQYKSQNLTGVTVNITGSASPFTTSTDGNYTFTNLAPGSYTITPSKAGYSITAATLSNISSNQTQNFTASGGYSVTGNVTWGAVNLQNVSMTLSGTTSEGLLVTESGYITNGSGVYTIPVPNGTYNSIVASKAGYTISPNPGSATVSGGSSTLNFTASGNWRIDGQVLYAGSGLNGVNVVLTGGDIPSSSSTPSATNGNYSYVGIGSGTYNIALTYPGYSITQSSPYSITSDRVLSHTATGILTITGKIVRSGTSSGLPWATVVLGGKESGTTTTDANGNYYFYNRAPGTYTITPTKPGYSIATTTENVGITSGTYTVPDLAASGNYSISGQVTHLGSGLPGVSLSLTGSATGTTTTIGDGSYTFSSLGDSNYTIVPTKSGYSFAPTSRSVTILGSSAVSQNFTATGNVTITGKVKTSYGVLTWATVTLSGEGSGTTKTDANGNYSFTNMGSGDYTITASKSGFSTVSSPLQTVSITTGTYTVPDITLPGNYTISGQVTHLGTGLSGVSLTLTGQSGNGTSIVTNAGDGTFSFNNIGDSSYTISFTKSGYTFSQNPLTINVNQASPPSQLITATGNVTITGVVKTSYGVLPWATVILTGEGSGTTKTDANGVYTFANMGSGDYTITVSKYGFSTVALPQTVSITSGTHSVTDITLTGNYSISGKLLHLGTGLSGVTLTLTGQSGKAIFPFTTASGGSYTFNNLGDSNYTITSTKTGYTFTPNPFAFTISDSNMTYRNILATGNVTMEGYIYHTGIGFLPGVTVSLTGEATTSVVTDANGKYSIPDLGTGHYTITPTKLGYTIGTISDENVTETTGIHAVAQLSATGNVTIRGVVKTSYGVLPWATVSLSGERNVTTTTDATGTYTFANMGSGDYIITVSKPGFTTTILTPPTISITSGTFNASDIILPGKWSISGTIKHLNVGLPIVSLLLEGQATGTMSNASDGTFTFSDLGDSSYTIKASKAGYTFSPYPLSITLINGGATAQDIAATGNVTIEGYVYHTGIGFLPGVTVSLTGEAIATTTTDSSGKYSFPNMGTGIYTITPIKPGYTITVASNENVPETTGVHTVTQHTATGNITISGKVAHLTSGLPWTTVTLSGEASKVTTTNINGNFAFPNMGTGNYTITPTKPGYTITASNPTVSIISGTHTEPTYIATGNYKIDGKVFYLGQGLGNSKIVLNGQAIDSTVTNSGGNYTFTNMGDSNYTIVATKPGFTILPNPLLTTIIGSDQLSQNFNATLNTYTLSGLLSELSSPLTGINMNLTGDLTNSLITSSPVTQGQTTYNYQFIANALGNYTITPEKVGYRFTPPTYNYTNLLNNQYQTISAYKVSEIYPDANSLSYGVLPINSTKKLYLKIKNPGLLPLSITGLTLIDTNASEFKVEPVTLPITVVPNDSLTLTIDFTPISPTSKVASLQITHNAPSQNTFIRLTGFGKSPIIDLSTTNINCDSTGFLQPSIDSGIILRNQTDTTIVISSIYFDTQDTIFQILQQGTSFNYSTDLKKQSNAGERLKLQQVPLYIYPYDSIKITVRFNSNTVGTFSNTLHIINDSYNSPHIQIPITGKTVGSNITSPLTTDLGTNELLSSPKDTTLNITNTGQYPLLINSLTIYPSTSPLEITNTFPSTGLLLNPGESYPVTLRLKTREPYHDSIQLIIQNNSSNNPFTAITIFGEVAKAKLSLTPTETDFGTTSVIIPQITKTILAENLASQRLTITGKKIIGDIESYKIRDDISPQQLEANGQSNIYIDFFPRSTGVKLCTLKVSYINPVNNVPSDLYIYMKGTGDGKPKLETNIDQINFGNLKLNSYKDTSIAVKNTGNLNLKISGELLSGTDKNQITITKSTNTQTLEMYQTDTIKIRITPTTPLGEKSATLQINTNDINKTINLTGYIKSPIEVTDINKIIWGEHYKGTNNDTIVTIRNTGNDTLKITNIITDGQTLNDFTLPELQLPITLMPQDESAIKVRFNPVIAGTRFARIIIMSSDPVNPELPIPLRGTGVQGTPRMELFTDTINFQPIPFGETTTETFTISNTGTDTLRISVIDLTGTNTENFGTTNVTYPIKIPINTERQIDLKFSPTVSGDNYAQINIQSDDTTTIKKTIILHGICLGKSSIKISTDLIDYGIAEKGEIRDSIITISNQGTTGLKIDSLIIIGLNRADFKTENITLPFMINPSGTKQITIKYIPLSQISTRSDAKLQIYSDDVTTIIRGVTLKGVMTAVSITPKRLDFGKTSIDTPMTERKIFITNNSISALTIKSRAISEDTLSFKLKTITRNVNLPPGKTDTVTIGFYPRTTGTKTSILTIATSDTITPTFTVINSGEGGGRPKLYSTAEKINFGILGLGITKDTNIIIRNDGNLDLQITEKNITGKDKDYFTIIEGSTPKILQSGQEETMKIRLTGRVPVGDKIAQLQIASNDNERNPTNIDLIGLTKSPVIALSVNKINLDTVSIGDTSKADFTIKNGGNDTLIINSISLEGDTLKNYFTTGYQLPIKLQPNETKSITIGYSPTNYGASSVNIIINSNDVTVPNTKIEVNGMGKKSNVITASPLKIELTGVTIYRTKDTTIVITNEDINPRWIKTITITGDNTQFEIQKIDSFKLAANETKNIVVKYKPTTEGICKCKIEIIPLDTIRNQKITINITGTSIIPITKIQNTEINFPNVRVNTTRDTIITVENRGAGILEIREVLITGDTSDYKTAVIQNPKEVQPGGKTEITISFIPKSSGDKNATITLRTNEPNNVMTNVKLKGKGIEPKLTISSAKIDMGRIFVILKKDTSFAITNTGTDILNIKKIYTSGLDSARFMITGTSLILPVNMKPNETMKVTLQFCSLTKGKKESEIKIESDDPAKASTTIALTGEGTIPKINLDGDLIAEENQDKKINFYLSEPYNPISIRIYYKKGNTNRYDSVTIQPSGTLNNSYTFTKELITKSGFDFYIKYICEGIDITIPDTNYKNSPLTYQIFIKNYENAVHFYPKSYSMVSVPLYFNSTSIVQEIISNLGPYNSSSWRIFRLSGEKYIEYTDGDNDGDETILLPGDGFWMITNENKGLTFHNSLTVPTNKEYRIRLQPGWNQIGSPFTFMIPVTGMKIPDNKRIEKTLWDWTLDGEYRIEDKYFEPWKGYFIKNNEVDSIDVFMSPISELTATGLTKTEQTNSNTTSTMKEGEWKYQVEIKNLENNSTTKQITDAIEFGCLTTGEEGWDKNDVGEPPISPKGTKTILGSIRFQHNDWNECKGNYIKDYRDLNNRGNTWELEIERSHPFFSNHQYELILNRIGDSPQDNEVLIHDYDNINSKVYNEGSILFQRIEHKFNFGLDKSRKKLRIVVGTKSYVSEMKEQINNEIKQQPITAYLLKQNYPNPFNPGTIIEYEIPKSELVKIIIYNTLGQEVQTLLNKYQETGRYSIEWNPKEKSGGLPSGIYFYELTSGSFKQIKKMLYLR